MKSPTKPNRPFPAWRRLPYPLPPQIRVILSNANLRELGRLCALTGGLPGEVAAGLLAGDLLSKPASLQPRGAAQALWNLHQERQLELRPTVSQASNHPFSRVPRVVIKTSSVRIPLSPRLNQQLYQLAKESGIAPSTLAREILAKTITALTPTATELEQRITQPNPPADSLLGGATAQAEAAGHSLSNS